MKTVSIQIGNSDHMESAKIPKDKFPLVLELHALVVEHYVRTANKIFPLN